MGKNSNSNLLTIILFVIMIVIAFVLKMMVGGTVASFITVGVVLAILFFIDRK